MNDRLNAGERALAGRPHRPGDAPDRASRRTLLAVAGGVALVAAGGVWRVMRNPERAYGPWRMDPAPPADIRLDAFRHAVLAPNPHNRQPWLIRLVGKDEAVVGCDLDRRLPMTDPFDRQITIGFGCFIELAAIAAAERGYRLEIAPFPEGAPEAPARLDARPIAWLKFVPDRAIKRDPLYSTILSRRSSKVPYDLARPIAAEALAALTAGANPAIRAAFALTPAEIAPLRAMAAAAWDTEYRTARTWKESVDLIRVGAAEIDANPDGISVKGPLFEALSLLGTDAVRAQAADPNSSAAASTVKRYTDIFAGTPAFLWLASAGNTRAIHIAAGRAYARQNLTATAFGLSMQPVSQALQEYPEMTKSLAEARRLCSVADDETLQMLSRLGYAPPVDPTPRWPVEAKLRT